MSSNLQQLLDALGRPPAEVCIDWAWQLHCHALESEQIGATASHSDWHHWTMTDDGLLVKGGVVSSSLSGSSSTRSTRHLIADLLNWAGVHWESDADQVSPDEQLFAILQLQTRLGFNGGVDKPSPIPACPSPSNRTRHGMNDLPSKGLLKSTAASLPKDSVQVQPTFTQQSKTSSARAIRLGKPSRRIRRTAGVIASLMLIILSVSWWYLSANAPRQGLRSGLTTDSVVSSTLGSERPSTSRPVDTRGKHSESIEGESSSFSDAQEVRLSESTDLLASMNIELPVGESELPDRLEPREFLSNVADSLSVLQGPRSPQPDEEIPARPDAEQIPANDSLSGLSILLDAAEPELVVRDMSDDIVNSSIRVLPAELISIGKAKQELRIPSGLRVKHPYWYLRLQPSDMFLVEPAGSQRLWDRAILTWTLVPVEAPRRKAEELVRVIVQAQLSSGKADIRWSVTAVAQDLPSVVVPLEVTQIDQSLGLASELKNRLTMAIDATKAQAGQSGLKPAMRSLLQGRRRQLEDQASLLQKVERLLSDVSLYVSWLGESIEVCGTLVEKADPQHPEIVLQLGEPDESILLQ